VLAAALAKAVPCAGRAWIWEPDRFCLGRGAGGARKAAAVLGSTRIELRAILSFCSNRMGRGTMTSMVAGRMAEAAAMLIESWDQAQRRIGCRPFPDEAERRLWYYTPTDHGGLPLAAMGPIQHRNVHRLVATGLSTAGYVTVALIIGLDNILDQLEGWSVDFGRARGRDPLLYYITIFGEPGGDGPWGWRFGGHHVSLHYTIIGGEVVASTPNFLGADPADSPLLGPHLHRPLAAAEDLGRELFRSLDGPRRARALVSPVAPTDLIGSNRPRLEVGNRPLPIADIFRRRFEGRLAELVADMQSNLEATIGVKQAHLDAMSFSAQPKGIPVEALDPGQTSILRELLGCYLARLPDQLADQQAHLVDHEFERLSFLWAGSPERHQPHYYRIQGERVLIEYDNSQRGANHVHTVWRDLANDFGGDALARHYAQSRH
jgi:hypothetical protein